MILLVATIMLVIRLEDQGVVQTPIRKLVTTSADITYLSELGKSWLKKEDETIMVSSDIGQTELLTFTNAQVFKEGFLLQYDVGLLSMQGKAVSLFLQVIQNIQGKR